MRRSTLLLKQELADSLGEDGKDYWIKLGEFLRGQCSKAELDSVGLQVFTAPYQGRSPSSQHRDERLFISNSCSLYLIYSENS